MKKPWNDEKTETVSMFMYRKDFRNVTFAITAEAEENLMNNPDWKYIGLFDVNLETKEVIG